MQADNKSIKDWLIDIERGVIRLPRFQRKEVWNPEITKKFLKAIIEKHPLGMLLLLEVDSNKQPFETRAITGITKYSEGCRLHLLDGQQRLTSLLRMLKDNYEDRAYYIKFVVDDKGIYHFEDTEHCTKSQPWYNDPVKEYEREWLPVHLFEPNERTRFNKWKTDVARAKAWEDAEKEQFEDFCAELREIISTTIIPFQSIPQGTPRETAIEIFQNINTSSFKLRPFDIANALCESKVSESLQEYVDIVKRRCPKLTQLEGKKGLEDMILKLACMRQNMKPKMGNYKELDFKQLFDWQNSLIKGLEWTQEFMIHEGIWDRRWLPSTVPFRVLPLLYDDFNQYKRNNRAKAMTLIRSYLWRAFLTERYTMQANDCLDEDYRILKTKLQNKDFRIIGPRHTIFNKEDNPLPREDEVMEEGWPKTQGRLKRAILAVCVKKGARGIETNELLTYDLSPKKRDYHHVFPRALLNESRSASLVVNCMMLEPEANSSWKDKWPGDYLVEKVEENGGGDKGREKVTELLETHTLPADLLLNARSDRGRSVSSSYDEFIKARTELILLAMKTLYDGYEYTRK